MMINFGCGEDFKKGWVNVDRDNSYNNRIIQMDLNYSLPYSNNSVTKIHCEHLLSYLDNPANFLEEVYRIAKPNASFTLIVNHFSLAFSYAEVTKKRSGFSYFTFGHKEWNREYYNRFKVKSKRINFTRINHKWLNKIFNPIINKFPVAYERFFCYIFPASEVAFELQIKK